MYNELLENIKVLDKDVGHSAMKKRAHTSVHW